MKAGIHPVYKPVKVICVCGNSFETRSTYEKPEMHVEICAACHPFFTGKQKLVDKAGRVERFRRRYAKPEAKGAAAKGEAAQGETASKAEPAPKS